MDSKLFLISLLKLINNCNIVSSNELQMIISQLNKNNNFLNDIKLNDIKLKINEISDEYDVVAIKLILLIHSNFKF